MCLVARLATLGGEILQLLLGFVGEVVRVGFARALGKSTVWVPGRVDTRGHALVWPGHGNGLGVGAGSVVALGKSAVCVPVVGHYC